MSFTRKRLYMLGIGAICILSVLAWFNIGLHVPVGTHLRGVRNWPCGRLGEPSLPVTRGMPGLNHASVFIGHSVSVDTQSTQRVVLPLDRSPVIAIHGYDVEKQLNDGSFCIGIYSDGSWFLSGIPVGMFDAKKLSQDDVEEIIGGLRSRGFFDLSNSRISSEISQKEHETRHIIGSMGSPDVYLTVRTETICNTLYCKDIIAKSKAFESSSETKKLAECLVFLENLIFAYPNGQPSGLFGGPGIIVQGDSAGLKPGENSREDSSGAQK